jgi:outer membrane protein OmpA-like peptidoglycan-associated protein
MRSITAFVVALLALLVSNVPAYAQEDAEGAKDHPQVSRFPGYRIYEYDEQEFGAAEFRRPDGGETHVEGKYWKIHYDLKEGAKKAGPIQIARNYLNTFTSRKGTKILEDADANAGTVVAKLPVSGKFVWLQVDVWNAGQSYALTIVEEGAMEQKVEFTAAELAVALREKGSVAVYGILFDTGKATIKAESAAALAPIGELLKNDSGLKLEIQGHTDNVGAKTVNLKLSQDRATAVKGYLVKTFSIAPERLSTAGLGDTKPVAANTSDDGRAQNRRVELVKK